NEVSCTNRAANSLVDDRSLIEAARSRKRQDADFHTNLRESGLTEVSKYVHYGCLFCAPKSWLNFDASPTLIFERIPIVGRFYTKNQQRFPTNVRYGDIVKGLPIPEDSCRGLYCSHVLEHLARRDCQRALRNSYGYLQPGGTFRMVLPDLEVLARA